MIETIAIIWLVATNIMALYVILQLKLIEKAKDLSDYKKWKEEKKIEKKETPEEIRVKQY